MEETPSESVASGSQIHPIVRQRMLNRAATFAEGGPASKPLVIRRRSSLLSDLSDSRRSLHSSTENIFRTEGKSDATDIALSDEPSHWISIPIFAAIVPAVVGLTYENGAAAATDVMMLALASWFLHWCVRVPWDWYHEAQQKQYEYADAGGIQHDVTISEEDEDDVVSPDERPESTLDNAQDLDMGESASLSPAREAQRDAREQLKQQEVVAFACCFLGPLLGAVLLHSIRGQLTRTEGIVSNFNLVIFFLSAELRPCRRLIEMRKKKILHLQRIVQMDPRDQLKPADAKQLSQRIAEVEAHVIKLSDNNGLDVTKVSADVRQSMQLQLDALNRAVRRYEKRQMAQSIQIEARFQEIDARLEDSLSLAAAAARTGQRPGIVSMTASWTVGIVYGLLNAIWSTTAHPFRTATAAARLVRSLLVKEDRQPRRRGKGQVNGHHPHSNFKVQSKSGR